MTTTSHSETTISHHEQLPVLSSSQVVSAAHESLPHLTAVGAYERTTSDVLGLLKDLTGTLPQDAETASSGEYRSPTTGTRFTVKTSVANYVTEVSVSADNPDWNVSSDRGTIAFLRMLTIKVDAKNDPQPGVVVNGRLEVVYQEVPEHHKYSTGTLATFS